jgi:ribosome-binding protein aMBF1 (putative translation factor)
MIKNDRQFRITKAQAEKFDRAITDTASAPKRAIHPVLQKAEMDALKSQLSDLRQELEEYSALRSGKRKTVALGSFDDLPKTLIQARIAAGLTQEELASKLGLKPQQIQRYEATDYHSASMQRINEILRTLGVRLRHRVELRLASS